ncbi:MAG: helicase-associated domain-containing protein [Actinomycetales bacterium]|nr:helicase-associated domain-containing protein [Actinomycetales bacterium]
MIPAADTPGIGHPRRRTRSLADDLRQWDDQSLTDLLLARPDLLRPAPRDIAALAARATTGPSTTRCLDRLGALDLHVLGRLAAASAEAPIAADRLIERCITGLATAEPHDEGLADALRASLARVRGLALAWGPTDELRATHAVREALAGSPGAPASAWPEPGLVLAPEVPSAACEAEAGWHAAEMMTRVRDLLDEWGRHPPAVLRAGGLGVREFAQARSTMHADVPGAALVIELAHAAGLLDEDGQAPASWVPTDGYDAWQEMAPEQAWLALAHAWLTLPRLPSLTTERSNPLSQHGDRRAVIGMRQAVLRLLAAAPPYRPVDPVSVLAVLDHRQPRLAGTLRQDVIRATMAEAAALGILAAGSLSAAGRALLEPSGERLARTRMAEAMPAPVDRVLIQADLTIVAPGMLTADLQRRLRLLADLESTGHASVYRVSTQTLARAMDTGLGAADVRSLLASISRTAIPPSLDTLIDDVGRRHGMVRVGLATCYIRSDDAVTTATISADRRLARLGLTRIDEHVLIASAPAPEVMQALRAAGYAAAGEAPDGSAVIEPVLTRRTPPRRVPAEVRQVTTAMARAAVRALRSSDHPPVQADSDPLVDARRRCSGAAALTLLREAAALAQPAWLSYAESDGTTTEQVVDPIRVAPGTLTAFDHRTGQVRTFVLARIAAAAPAQAVD